MPIRVYGSNHSEAEDILWGTIRRADLEFSKERVFLLQGSLKTEVRDLLGGGVNLLVVIAVDFLSKDLLGGFDVSNIFSDTDSDESVLDPAIRAFHLSFGLWRQGISDFDITILEDLFPLRGGFIG
jgi:hypothetical protein